MGLMWMSRLRIYLAWVLENISRLIQVLQHIFRLIGVFERLSVCNEDIEAPVTLVLHVRYVQAMWCGCEDVVLHVLSSTWCM